MTSRPLKPTIAQIREISQPVSVTGRSNAEHWVADLYLRKISPYLTRLLLKTPISANGITYLMIATGISISAALLIPGYIGILLALFLSQLQMLWDCCDGEIARWRQTQSPKGVFLDRLGHYLTESLIPVALGLRLSGWPENQVTDWKPPFIGALIGIMILWNKAFNDIVHVSRAFAGLEKLADAKSVGTPTKNWLRIAKAPFRIFAVQRLFHSVEMSIIIVIFNGSEKLLNWGIYLAIFVTAGHLLSILGSRKLDRG
ncbi:MAG: CDP-alcohol phosphatidyltransferase family protein [Candidatus Nanopelagicaceae bacterium]|nr:CDP-alcohol phosphatidyltransferase family protein [Candidatus Nanopelagicaceae bacterium]